jgi:hypothetical protein
VLKRNGIAPPTPIDQVSAQSDKVYYVFVHPESKSVKTAILIAKSFQNVIFVKKSYWVNVKVEKSKIRLYLTLPTFSNLF